MSAKIRSQKSLPVSILSHFSFYIWQEKSWEETPIKTYALSKGDALQKMKRRIPDKFQKIAFHPSGNEESVFTRLTNSFKVDTSGLGTHKDPINESLPQRKATA